MLPRTIRMRNDKRKKVFAILGLWFVALVISRPPAYAGYEEGEKARRRGDFKTAEREFRRGAEQGETVAQYELGQMYESGQGVPQNYQEAATWMRRAAELGLQKAQARLAEYYYEGKGVPKDHTLALMWLNRAGPLWFGHPLREKLTPTSRPSEVEQSRRLTKEGKVNQSSRGAVAVEQTRMPGALRAKYNGATVRSQQDPSSEVVERLPHGEEVVPLAEIPGPGDLWYMVRTKTGAVGWVRGDDVEELPKIK